MLFECGSKSWPLRVNVGTLRRLKADYNIDLLDVQDGGALAIAADPLKLADVLLVLCSVPDSDVDAFADSLDGESLERGSQLLIDGLVAFFLKFRPAVGKVLQTAALRIREAEAQMGLWGEEQLTQERVSKILQEAVEAHGKQFGS